MTDEAVKDLVGEGTWELVQATVERWKALPDTARSGVAAGRKRHWTGGLKLRPYEEVVRGWMNTLKRVEQVEVPSQWHLRVAQHATAVGLRSIHQLRGLLLEDVTHAAQDNFEVAND